MTFALAVEFNRRRFAEMSYGGLNGAELDGERSPRFPKAIEIWQGYAARRPDSGNTQGLPLVPSFTIDPFGASESWGFAVQDVIDAEYKRFGLIWRYYAFGFVGLPEPFLLLLPRAFKPVRR